MLNGEPIQLDTAQHTFAITLLRFRLRWMKVGPRVVYVNSLVDSFKATIILPVSTMKLAVAVQQNAPEAIR